MIKVYRAFYKTSWIYNEGYVVVFPDNTVKGVFAFDYIYIYKDEEKYTLFLKEKSFFKEFGLILCGIKHYEFYSYNKLNFHLFDQYLFFAPCAQTEDNSIGITGLSLELQEEILDGEHIKEILLSIKEVEA